MSTGTTIRIFKHPKNGAKLTQKQYDEFLERAKEESNCGILPLDAPETQYSRYTALGDYDSDEITWVYNSVTNINIMPKIDQLSIVEEIGEQNFISCFDILVDLWQMDAYTVTGRQHIVTKDEISEFLAVANYIDSDAFHDKKAQQHEPKLFADNHFFKAITNELPSRRWIRELKQGDAELVEMESDTRWFCSSIATFMKFYNIINSDSEYEYKKFFYNLVYFKW